MLTIYEYVFTQSIKADIIVIKRSIGVMNMIEEDNKDSLNIDQPIKIIGKGGKREGAGRPAEAGERRTARSIKFSTEEWEAVKKKAKEQGLNVSEYIRKKILTF